MDKKIKYFVTNEEQGTQFKVQLNTLPKEGNIAWEYNPFRNYRLDEDSYEYDGYYYNLYDLYIKYGIQPNCNIVKKSIDDKGIITFEIDKQSTEVNSGKLIKEIYEAGNTYNIKNLLRAIKDINTWNGVPSDQTDPILREKGELVDFITNELSFDLKHPVDILPQNSYDNSVNLILNDGKNYPRLINSRFSPQGKNRYIIEDRKGNSDTNIYDKGKEFNTDTSLYKIINTFPKLKLNGITDGGNLKIGNYCFYFKLEDADGNETDFFEESGLVSIFIGGHSYSGSQTGQMDNNSFKQVIFSLNNLDTSYTSVIVYYTRYSAERNYSRTVTHHKIDFKYNINNNGAATVIITGFEPTTEVSDEAINQMYTYYQSAETQASCQNRLFLGNVKKPDQYYKFLTQASLRFTPEYAEEIYDTSITNRYSFQSNSKNSYVDPEFIYNKTGYWDQELYRIGIVYIMENGELSPVFNIRGACNLNNDIKCSNINLYEENRLDDNLESGLIEIPYDEETYKIINAEGITVNSDVYYENVKGVIRCQASKDTNIIHYFKIKTTSEVINALKGIVKGFFFVRQNRMPTILAQGITVGVDKHSRTPTIPVYGGDMFKNMTSELSGKTHVTTENLNSLNYISEGFLNRYSFEFKPKKSSIWGKILKITGIVAAVAVAAVATIYTCGATTPIFSSIGSFVVGLLHVANASAIGTAVVGAATIVVGSTVGAAAITATYAGIQDLVHATTRLVHQKNKLLGRKTKCPEGYEIHELEDSRTLTHEFKKRIIIKDKSSNENTAIICPEYDVNAPYLNNIFNGNEHYIEPTITQCPEIIDNIDNYSYRYFTNNNRQFYISQYIDTPIKQGIKTKLIALEDNQKVAGINDILFRARAGEAEEVWKYRAISDDHLIYKDNEFDDKNLDNIKINSDIIRGSFGPYLAIQDNILGPAETVNIFIPGFDRNNMDNYVRLRINDSSPYYTITNRINLYDLIEYQKNIFDASEYYFPIFRGDCYICQYTHRFNRNFQDPASPYNDIITAKNTWKENYNPKKADYDSINRGDVNAVQMGMWLTFTVRSSRNLNVLTIDDSIIGEKVMCGHPRAHYPQMPMSVEGGYKLPDSALYNNGFLEALSQKAYFTLPDSPFIKHTFPTRIAYSDIQVVDGFKNGFRQFWKTNFRDYPIDYGSITKILNYNGDIVCVFEHGVSIIPVNERTVSGQSQGGHVYINTNKVLPQNPKIVSDKYGSQWKESVIQTPTAIYGVDTIAKKIWRLSSDGFKCISDNAVQSFLNQNITLTERELEPIIGIRNVKTHYNAFKSDVMFTFYDNLYGFEEKAWNLCWNELLQKWITFYSWIPSYSENIYNQYFSFNRDTSKYIAKLGVSKEGNDFSDGVVLSNNIMTHHQESTTPKELKEKLGKKSIKIGQLSLVNRYIDSSSHITHTCDFELIRDVWGNYKHFGISNDDILYASSDYQQLFNKDYPVIYLNIIANIKYDKHTDDETSLYDNIITEKNKTIELSGGFYQSTIAISTNNHVKELTTDFWQHGQAGIIDKKTTIYPTNWYGEQHPFEFEFVVNDQPGFHKIFDNLVIISNNAEPESFHYEIVGDCYDFAEDKETMYIRQEATKELYQYNGVNITYDHNYPYIENRKIAKGSPRLKKSTVFPLWYARQDKINRIEDFYHLHSENTKDFSQLSGAEIVRDNITGEYKIWNHTPAKNVGNVLRDNMKYLEDRWFIQINPINLVQKNETAEDWDNKYRSDIQDKTDTLVPVDTGFITPEENISKANLPNNWQRNIIQWKDSETNNQQIKVKDKYMKVRIRYSGKQLAIIAAINTLYSISQV